MVLKLEIKEEYTLSLSLSLTEVSLGGSTSRVTRTWLMRHNSEPSAMIHAVTSTPAVSMDDNSAVFPLTLQNHTALLVAILFVGVTCTKGVFALDRVLVRYVTASTSLMSIRSCNNRKLIIGF